MSEICDGIPRNTSPFVIYIMLIVNLKVGAIRNKVKKPIEQDEKPNEPQGQALTNMSLKLSKIWFTFCVVRVDAQQSLSPVLDISQALGKVILLVDSVGNALILQTKLETSMVVFPLEAVYH